MSYSFTVKGASAKDISDAAKREIETIIQSQPMHEKDKWAAIEAVDSLANVITTVPGKELVANVSGSISWEANGAIKGVSISVSVYEPA